MQEPFVPVTGVARGGLGTATNLEDTQVYSLEDLREPIADPGEYEAADLEAAVPIEASAPALAATIEPEPAPVAVERPRAATAARPRAVRRSPSGSRAVGPIVVGALAVLGLAAVLTLRDAPAAGPGGLGGGTGTGADAGTFPPFATGPAPTTVTDEGGGAGKDKGKGKGNGNGGGNGND